MGTIIRLIMTLVMSFPGAPLPDGIVLAEPSCPDTLAMVQKRLPSDLGTRWVWSDLSTRGSSGEYFRGQDLIVVSSVIDCRWVPIVATHEWMHQVQDSTGVRDESLVNGYNRFEIVADCTARVITDHYGWDRFDSYPELSGTPCTSVAQDVEALLQLI